MAATPASAYRAYRSKAVDTPTRMMWLQIDLGSTIPIDHILLYPASERMFPGRDQYYAGEGFPLRFKIETSNERRLQQSGHGSRPDAIGFSRSRGSYHEVLRPWPSCPLRAAHGHPAARGEDVARVGQRLMKISRTTPITRSPWRDIGVLSSGEDVGVGCTVTADSENGNPELLKQLTRPLRQDGEAIKFDHPNLVTDPSTWKRVRFKAEAPRGGVTLDGGTFQSALQNNAQYLLNFYTTDDLLRQFYERTGKVTGFRAGRIAGILGRRPGRIQRRPLPDGCRQYVALDRRCRAAQTAEHGGGRN